MQLSWLVFFRCQRGVQTVLSRKIFWKSQRASFFLIQRTPLFQAPLPYRRDHSLSANLPRLLV